MELMFDLQQYGQPPADIIKGLAPGLQFDENGMPIMPNMGSGLMPEVPGGTTMPNLGEAATAMANGQCCIM
jgi:peroxin-19